MKVSILGAGPAGSTAAYYLAKGGVAVELIDRVEFPREKPCAGGLFNPSLFEKEFPYLKKFKGKELFNANFSCCNYSFSYKSSEPLLKTSLRKDFDFFLLKSAVEAGADFRVQKNPSPNGDFIIDATGAKRIRDYSKAGICMVYDFPVKNDIDTVYVHYGFHGIKGYCWLYPKKGHANIGVGAYLPQKNIRKVYELYIDYLVKKGVVSICEKLYRSKIIPFSPAKSFYSGNILKVGDAAGFVRPGTGEGIYFAMLSGKIAAKTIIEKKNPKWYTDQCMHEFGRYLKSTVTVLPTPLVNKIMQKAVKIGSKDECFRKMLVEDFFRLKYHQPGMRFIRNILK